MTSPAAWTLKQVVPGDDPRLVAALIRLLDSGTPTQASDAALVLNVLEPPAPAAVPALIAALRRESQSVRFYASAALGRYAGAGREAAIPPLVAALADTDMGVRHHAAKSLAHLGAGAVEAVPMLIAMLDQENASYRSYAAETLGEHGPAARLALPALRAHRSDPIGFVRDAVAKAILLIDPPAPLPVP